MRDGKQDCTQSALAVCAKVFVDDFLLFDVAKPITDASHFEIEEHPQLKGISDRWRPAPSTGCHRYLADVDGESRLRVSGRGDDESNKAGPETFRILPHRMWTCRCGGDGRCQRSARQGLGADRPVWRRLWHHLIAKIARPELGWVNCVPLKRSTESRSSNVSRRSITQNGSIDIPISRVCRLQTTPEYCR